MNKFFARAGPALEYLKPWLITFLVGLILSIGQAIIALTDMEGGLKASNIATVIWTTFVVYVFTKVKHIQVKDLQAIIAGLLDALNKEPLPAQEPVTPAQQVEADKG